MKTQASDHANSAASAGCDSRSALRLLLVVYLAVVMAVLLFRAAALRAAPAEDESADLILHHGQIVTVDENFTVVEAMAVRGEQIVKFGGNDEVLKLRGPKTSVVDLEGQDGAARLDRFACRIRPTLRSPSSTTRFPT